MPHIIVKESKIFYKEINKKYSNAIVLLHGLGTDHNCFKYQITELRKLEYRLILIDLPGFGKSKNSGNIYNIRDLADLVSEFITIIKITKFHFIGLSLGGMIALDIVRSGKFCKSLNKVILISTAVTFKKVPVLQKIPLYVRLVLTMLVPYRILMERISKKVFPDENMQDLQLEFYSQLLNANSKIYRNIIWNIKGWDFTPYLNKISNAYWIYGDNDTTIQATQQQKFLNEKNVIIIKGNHAVNIVNPKETNQHILTSLKLDHVRALAPMRLRS